MLFDKTNTSTSALIEVHIRASRFWSLVLPHLDNSAKKVVNQLQEQGYCPVFAAIDFCEGFVQMRKAQEKHTQPMLPFVPDDYEGGLMLQVGANFALRKTLLSRETLEKTGKLLLKALLESVKPEETSNASMPREFDLGNGEKLAVHVVEADDLPEFLKSLIRK